ncbi:CIAO1 [Enterospora canceri]|uniref:CIAO1 n=1 Tax=Enterospora canceri TaxID=1081671 RepID=A0A1Y1S881_9MICR|nr:CIAO1 [Enterospora canceri]
MRVGRRIQLPKSGKKFYDRIRALVVDDGVIYGAYGSELYRIGEKVELICGHDKTVSSVSVGGRFLVCASYDCTATIFIKNGSVEFHDTVEGPETEIKACYVGDGQLLLATRGQVVWVLDASNGSFEVTRIIDDHSQDVKGVRKWGGRVYSWSYDRTVKEYAGDEIELVDSVDCGSIVWNTLFVGDKMVAFLQNGSMRVFRKAGGFWQVESVIPVSHTPILHSCLSVEHSLIAVVANGTVLVIFDDEFNIINRCDLGSRIDSICFSGETVLVGVDGWIWYIDEVVIRVSGGSN